MRKVRSSLWAVLLAPGVASLFAVALFTPNWHEATALRSFVMSLVYAYSIGVPVGFALPVVVRRAGRSPARLALAIAAVMLPLIGIGCLAAGAILAAAGLIHAGQFWPVYAFTVRTAAILGMLISAVDYFFELLAAQLQETLLRLQERELEQERERKLALEARLASLESRIHPHFLFNTLNSISALIHDEPQRAEEIVGRLAALLRFSLDTNQCSLIPLEQEFKIVRDYLEIEKARFGERLRYSIDVAPEVQHASLPPLAVESLVENSVKHAIAPRREGGEVRVSARGVDGSVEIEVADSGPGFSLEAIPRGHGIDNLLARLEVLYNGQARLDVGAADGRSSVRLVLPERT